MSIIDKIIKLLDESKRNQKDLTDYLGLEKSVFSAWKSGKSKSYMKHLPKIAEFLNTSVDYLLDNKKSSQSAESELNDVYLSYAKEMQENDIDPDDIALAIETIKNMKRKKGGE